MQPKLATLIAAIIAEWTLVETYTGMLFTTLLPGEQSIAHEIYHAFFESGQRTRIFLTVAKKKLSRELYAKAEKYLSDARAGASDRHIVAHSLWCFSPSAPDCLCAIDQISITMNFISKVKILLKNDPAVPNDITDYGKGARLMAYSEQDFINMLQRMRRLDERGLQLALEFTAYLNPPLDDAAS